MCEEIPSIVSELHKIAFGREETFLLSPSNFQIFVDLANQLEDAYVPYFQGLTAALELFKECKAKNSKFRHYIKVVPLSPISSLSSLPGKRERSKYRQAEGRIFVEHSDAAVDESGGSHSQG